jgi:hypothetical protein
VKRRRSFGKIKEMSASLTPPDLEGSEAKPVGDRRGVLQKLLV